MPGRSGNGLSNHQMNGERKSHFSFFPALSRAGKSKHLLQKYRNYPKRVLWATTGTALKSHGKRAVLVLSLQGQLFTGTAGSRGSKWAYRPLVPNLQAGTQNGIGGEKELYPRKPDTMILPENSSKYHQQLQREEIQWSHHHRPAKGAEVQPGRDQPNKGLWISSSIRCFSPTVEPS